MSQLLKSSGAMGAATLLSRILGMVREMVYARFMGDSPVAGAFQLAFTIPNLFRRLLGEGALTAAFIPLFKARERSQGEPAMWHAANAVLSGLLVAGSTIVLLVVAGLSLALWLWPFEPETRLLLELSRIMFPYMLLVCLAAGFVAMLNARGQFFLPAMGTTLLNVAMIASVLFLAPRMGPTLELQIFGLAYGVIVAGILQAAFQTPALRREGFRFRWVPPWGNPDVLEVVRKMIPGTLGVAAFQINVVLTQSIAYWEDPRIVASFNYAVRLMELPQGVFGVSLATFLLPALSGLAADKNFSGFRTLLRQGLGHLLAVNLLASALLAALSVPIIRLIFERGEFGPAATDRAAFALACLAPGLAAFSTVNVIARAFYALGDTQTPMKISAVCLLLNLLFAAWLIQPMRQGGLGVANTLSACFNVGLLAYAFRRKMPRFDFRPLRNELLSLGGLALLAGFAAYGLSLAWESSLGHATVPRRVGAVFVPALGAAALYAAAAIGLGNPAITEVARMLLARFKPPSNPPS